MLFRLRMETFLAISRSHKIVVSSDVFGMWIFSHAVVEVAYAPVEEKQLSYTYAEFHTQIIWAYRPS